MSDQDKGLYNKYRIINRETGEEVEGEYFVLQPDKDAAARPAILRYAEETENLKLSMELYKWIQRIDAYAVCPEDEYPLLDGSVVILSPGDRVLFQRSSPSAIPLTIDADSIIDDVLQAYKGTLVWLGQVSQLRDQWYRLYLKALADVSEAAEEYDKRTSYYRGELRAGARELTEAQQSIARLTELLEEAGVIPELIEAALKREKQSPYPTLLDTTAVLNALLARQAEEGAKTEGCCSNPDIQTVNNEFVNNTTVCINCGRLFQEVQAHE